MKTLYDGKWLKVHKTDNGFEFAERRNKDSIALFLTRRIWNGVNTSLEVLVRFQPHCSFGDSMTDPRYVQSWPITGSLHDDMRDKSIFTIAVEEAWEEAGYKLKESDIHNIGFAGMGLYVGTQTNEQVYMLWADVTNLPNSEPMGDGSVLEKISYNKWLPLDWIKSSSNLICMSGYYRLKEVTE